MNILVLSCGTRNKIINYFKKSLKKEDRIIACDCSKYAPALYEADSFYIVPRIDANNYLDVIFEICKKEKINAILSLIDPELELLAHNRIFFESKGVKVIVSNEDVVKMAFDKYEMYKHCKKNNIKTVKSYITLEEFEKDYKNGFIDFPVFVKPYNGSCSKNISRIDSYKELTEVMGKFENLMIQEYMDGQEIGVDVYIDSISGKVINIFTKKKILMRAGETDKSISFKDQKLFDFIEKFISKTPFSYNIDIDIFEKDGEYYISEVNPRFGGGYPHAYESGCDFMKLIINNVNGITNKPSIGNYEENIVMMKYLDLMVKKF